MEIHDIERIQSKLKKDIGKLISNGKNIRALKLIDTYADITRSINNILRDDEIEHFIKSISDTSIDKRKIVQPDINTIVFYDQVGSTICLGLQYIRGLIANGYKIVYIYESPFYSTIDQALLTVLEEYNIEYYLFDFNKLNGKEQFIFETIRDVIIKSRASNLIIQSPAMGACGSAVLYSIQGITKYRIVPGDHHFYVGYDCVDYFLEFRPFGISLAINERCIPHNKIYRIPYYPIIDEFAGFNGFPLQTNGKLVFLAAGAAYKFLGSDVFYELCLYILQHEKTVILFAGELSERLASFIKSNDFSGKFIHIGYRKDFVQCVKHCDILINSYPFIGGLIAQTAAYYKKPIISYCTIDEYLESNTEDILGINTSNVNITHTSIAEAKCYIDELIKDDIFRAQEGNKAKTVLQTKISFDKTLNLIIGRSMNHVSSSFNIKFDRSDRVKRYLHLQNVYSPTLIISLLKSYNVKFCSSFPFLYKEIFKHVLVVMKYSFYPLYKWIQLVMINR